MYDRAWSQYSQRRLSQHPLCVRCARMGRDTLARVTDHMTPHKGDPLLFNDPNNHQSLCKPCHDSKTRLEDGGFGSLIASPKRAPRASCDVKTSTDDGRDT